MKKPVTLLSVLALAILFLKCGSGNDKPAETALNSVEAAPSEFNINFTFYPPSDLDSNATPQQLVEFAWEEFFALNWKSSYSKDNLRDHPDTTWSFSSDSKPFPDTLVWETYAHRSELRPYSNNMLPFNTAPHYSFGVPLSADSNASFTLFNVLDENNEIGSCDMFAHTNTYGKRYEVLYQAKVNKYEYNYILDHYPKKEALMAARLYTQKLVKDSGYYYAGVKNSCNCPENYKGISLPCGNKQNGKIGAMEVKTAWRELSPLDTASLFLTRTVIYFRKDPKTNKVSYANKTYALLGLHIIHKTTNYEDFVFATWEHKRVVQDAMGYQLLSQVNGSDSGALVTSFSRLHPVSAIADSSTSYVHRKLRTMNPNSIWLNYRLVGVQAKPTNDTTSFNFFLANYVVESDPTLNDFHGSGIGHPHNGLPNTFYRGNMLTMGGCQGCHGVAQTALGTDFSFLLDNVGKPIDTPDIQGDVRNKIQRLIQATRKK